jgi:hypothetical protein
MSLKALKETTEGVFAAQLGLPTGNWHRTDYLRLLRLLTKCFVRISEHFEALSDMDSEYGHSLEAFQRDKSADRVSK